MTDRKKSAGSRIRTLTYGAVIAAFYVILTYLSALFPGNVGGTVRPAEALCVLAAFTPAAVPGVTLGCLLSNLLLGGAPADVVCGTLVTLVSMLAGRLLRKHPILLPLPTVFLNAAFVPLILVRCYGMTAGYPVLFVTVFIGEALSAWGLGMLLFAALRKIRW